MSGARRTVVRTRSRARSVGPCHVFQAHGRRPVGAGGLLAQPARCAAGLLAQPARRFVGAAGLLAQRSVCAAQQQACGTEGPLAQPAVLSSAQPACCRSGQQACWRGRPATQPACWGSRPVDAGGMLARLACWHSQLQPETLNWHGPG